MSPPSYKVKNFKKFWNLKTLIHAWWCMSPRNWLDGWLVRVLASTIEVFRMLSSLSVSLPLESFVKLKSYSSTQSNAIQTKASDGKCRKNALRNRRVHPEDKCIHIISLLQENHVSNVFFLFRKFKSYQNFPDIT